jgi:hypothetical protein
MVMLLNPRVHVCINIRIAKGSRLLIMSSDIWADYSQACQASWGKLPIRTVSNQGYSYPPPPHGATAASGPGPRYRGFTFTLRHTPHSVGLLWTSDQSDTETPT